MTQEAAMTGSFNSLEERIAHLQWRKVCNEQQIQGTIRTSKQMQEHDTFVKASKCPHQEKKEWIHQVISEEFTKPLPVTSQFYQELTKQHEEDEKMFRENAKRHVRQIRQIQSKLEEREHQVARKQEFTRKKTLFQSQSCTK